MEKNLPSSWIGRITLVNIDILPKAVYKFNAIPIKISSKFFIKLVKLFLNSSEITTKPVKVKLFLSVKVVPWESASWTSGHTTKQ